MKLATALLERANIQNRIQELSTRLNNNSKVQDGDTPAENPKELLKELNDNFKELEELISKINHTNDITIIEDNKTIADYIARRDCLKQKIAILRSFLDSASEKINRYSKTEIKILSTVKVSELQKEIDTLSKELRIVDEKIQQANWTTEI